MDGFDLLYGEINTVGGKKNNISTEEILATVYSNKPFGYIEEYFLQEYVNFFPKKQALERKKIEDAEKSKNIELNYNEYVGKYTYKGDRLSGASKYDVDVLDISPDSIKIKFKIESFVNGEVKIYNSEERVLPASDDCIKGKYSSTNKENMNIDYAYNYATARTNNHSCVSIFKKLSSSDIFLALYESPFASDYKILQKDIAENHLKTKSSQENKVSSEIMSSGEKKDTDNSQIYSNNDFGTNKLPDNKQQSPGVSVNIVASSSLQSPIKSMIESSQNNNFQLTRQIKDNIKTRTYSENFDKKTAKQLNDKGIAFNKQGNTPEALKMFEAGYSINKSDVEIVGNLGYLLFLSGKFDEAINKLIEALEISPDRASTWFTLGQVYGYKKLENESYSCFVNTCLFSKNIDNTIKIMDREKDKQGELTIQNSASRALTTCQKMTNLSR